MGVIKVFTNLVKPDKEYNQGQMNKLEEQKCKIKQMNNATKDLSIEGINSKMLSSCEIDSLFQMIPRQNIGIKLQSK